MREPNINNSKFEQQSIGEICYQIHIAESDFSTFFRQKLRVIGGAKSFFDGFKKLTKKQKLLHV